MRSPKVTSPTRHICLDKNLIANAEDEDLDENDELNNDLVRANRTRPGPKTRPQWDGLVSSRPLITASSRFPDRGNTMHPSSHNQHTLSGAANAYEISNHGHSNSTQQTQMSLLQKRRAAAAADSAY